MGSASIALLLVAALALLQIAVAITKLVPGYGCTGYQFTVVLDKSNFTSYMGEYSTPVGCNSTYVKVSKMYVKGACVSTCSNNFGVFNATKNLNCDTVNTASTTTCTKVFANGPAESFVYGARVNDTIDSELVCWPTRSAFMYVYNGCPTAVNVTITGSIKPYQGSCDIVTVGSNKLGFSEATIGGIVAAVVLGSQLLVTTLIGLLVWCCL